MSLIGTLLVLFVFFVALIAALPWLLSQESIRSFVCKALHSSLKGELVVDSLELSFWKPIAASGIRYHSDDGELVFSCTSLSAASSLSTLFLRQHPLKECVLIAPKLAISLHKGKSASLTTTPSVEHPKTEEKKRLRIPFIGSIHISSGNISFINPDIEKTEISTIEADLILNNDAPILFACSGKVLSSDKTGTFSLKGNCDLSHLSMQAMIRDLPIVGIDRIASYFYPNLQRVLIDAIGDSLNLQANLRLSRTNCDISLEGNSPKSGFFLTTQTTNEAVSLLSPGYARFTITPFIAKTFLSLDLNNPSEVQLNINALHIPLTIERINWTLARLKATLLAENVELDHPFLESRVLFPKIEVEIQSPSLTEKVLCKGKITSSLHEQKGTLQASLEIDAPFATNRSILAEAFTKECPTHFFSSSTYIPSLFGEFFNARMVFNKTVNNGSLTLSLQSPYISCEEIALTLGEKELFLTNPLLVKTTLSTPFWAKWNSDIASQDLYLQIDALRVPYANIFSLKAAGSFRSAQINYNGFSLNTIQAHFTIDDPLNMHFHLTADGAKVDALAEYAPEKNKLFFKEKTAISLSKDLLAQIPSWKHFPFTLQDALFHLDIEPFSLSLAYPYFEDTKIQALLKIPHVCIENQKGQMALIQQGIVELFFNGKTEELLCNLSLEAKSTEERAIPINARYILAHDKNKKFSIEIAFEKLDTCFIDTLPLFKMDLLPLIGRWASLNATISVDESKRMIECLSSFENGSLNFSLEQKENELLLTEKKGNFLTLKLDDKGLRSIETLIQRPLSASLTSSVKIDCELPFLSIPLGTKTAAFTSEKWLDILVDGRIQIENLSFIQKNTNSPIALHHLTLQARRKQTTSPLIALLKAECEAKKHGLIAVKAEIDKNTTLTNQIESQTSFDFSTLHAMITGDLHDVPTALFDTVLEIGNVTKKPISTLCGESLSLHCLLDIIEGNGPLSLSIQSPQTRLSLSGSLRHGTLLLNDPLFAQIKVTEDIGRLFLKEISPLSLSAVEGEGPITVRIDPAGFALPLSPWNLKNIAIPAASIELGKLVCQNQGTLKIILGLLKLGQFSTSNDLILWFAPIDLSLEDGILELERTEILVENNIEIATWGNIDLLQHKLNATLGLTKQALSKAFGIEGLPENYILAIPINGSTDNVKINTSKATAKIALLIAGQRAEDTGNGGESKEGRFLGGFIGGVAKGIVVLPDANDENPPPKRPFPWETSDSSPKLPPKKRKNTIKPGDKPLKKLLKLLK